MVLTTLGYSVSDIIEDDDLGRPSIKIYYQKKADFNRVKSLFNKLALKNIVMKTKLMRPSDWVSRWKEHWKPSKLTRLLDVVPVWCCKQYKNPKGRDYILMDTLLSFGTGLHETTQIVAQMIEDHRTQIKSLMDIGTGTGVLAMVALKHGVPDVLAIDIGDLSVEAAKNNLKVNGLKAKVRKADINRFDHSGKYDFVAANLVTHDLIAAQTKITRLVKPGGLLAVSGISLSNCPVFEKGFHHKTFKILQTIKAKEWSGYLFQKKK